MKNVTFKKVCMEDQIDVIDPYHLHFTVTLNLKQAKNILVIN